MEPRTRSHFLGINWKVRFKNPQVVMAMTAAVLLLAEQILSLFGIQLEAAIGQQVTAIVQTILGILVLMGVVQDPTHEGFEDSPRALRYRTPEDAKKTQTEEGVSYYE